MADHHCFGVSSCSTSVDKTATVTWPLLKHFLKDNIILDIGSKLEEVFPEVDTVVIMFFGDGIDTENDNCLY